MDTSYSLSFTIYVKNGGETTSLKESDKELLKKLAIHYSKKENQDKLIKKVLTDKKRTDKLISNIKSKLPKKELAMLEQDAKAKADDKTYNVKQLFKDAFNYIKETIMPSFKKGAYKRILERSAVVFMFFFVIYINTFLHNCISIYIIDAIKQIPIFNSNVLDAIGTIITPALTAPLTEELYKYLTVKLNEKEFGWSVFNLYEFTYYVFRSGGFNVLNIPSIITRLLCTLSHLLWTKIHADDEVKDKYLPSFLHAIANGPVAIFTGILMGTANAFQIPEFVIKCIGFISELTYIKCMTMYVKKVKQRDRLKKESLVLQKSMRDKRTKRFIENYIEENKLTDFFKDMKKTYDDWDRSNPTLNDKAASFYNNSREIYWDIAVNPLTMKLNDMFNKAMGYTIRTGQLNPATAIPRGLTMKMLSFLGTNVLLFVARPDVRNMTRAVAKACNAGIISSDDMKRILKTKDKDEILSIIERFIFEAKRSNVIDRPSIAAIAKLAKKLKRSERTVVGAVSRTAKRAAKAGKETMKKAKTAYSDMKERNATSSAHEQSNDNTSSSTAKPKQARTATRPTAATPKKQPVTKKQAKAIIKRTTPRQRRGGGVSAQTA